MCDSKKRRKGAQHTKKKKRTKENCRRGADYTKNTED